MSWSVNAIGRAPAVAAAIDKQFTSQGVCQEPEETIRQLAKTMIAASLAAAGPDNAVEVAAAGSQSGTYTPADGKYVAPFTNSIQINVKPLYGFAG